MSTIFDVTGIISFLLTPIFLVTAFIFLFKKKNITKKLFLVSCVSFLVTIICAAISGSMIPPDESTKEVAKPKTEVADSSINSKEEDKKESANEEEEVDNSDKVEEDSKDESSQEHVHKPSTTTDVNFIESKIHFINTGNSDSIAIQSGNKAVLIDGGENNDETTVVQYLKRIGVSSISLLIATHNDADHIGGLDAVVKSFPVENVWVSNGSADTATYRDFINALASKNIKPSVPLPNNQFTFGSGTIRVLSANNTSDTNDNSIVVEYKNGEDNALFLGDLDAELDHNLNVGKVDLVKTAHHGAKNGTSQQLLNKTTPDYAVITTSGSHKGYGHPHAELLNRLGSNVEIHRTDECGDIVFVSTGKGLNVQCNTIGSRNPGPSSTSTTPSNQVSTNKPVAPSTPKPSQTETPNADTVYISTGGSGKKYHFDDDCRGLSNANGITSISLNDAKNKGYTICGWED